ncbi:hypothetical protein CC80DRAFT_543680 [Byssothecium circinans]|uniref:Uncharacterized protein n=1 Tax=Byssothecium circinans TaxID=147558 RepID=A0A6A5UAI1_9PLEO|nr:hypothetical protein CC80DRAFT_543680 [Byssothecium circinans]
MSNADGTGIDQVPELDFESALLRDGNFFRVEWTWQKKVNGKMEDVLLYGFTNDRTIAEFCRYYRKNKVEDKTLTGEEIQAVIKELEAKPERRLIVNKYIIGSEDLFCTSYLRNHFFESTREVGGDWERHCDLIEAQVEQEKREAQAAAAAARAEMETEESDDDDDNEGDGDAEHGHVA